MPKYLLLPLLVLISVATYSQEEKTIQTEKVLRVNFLNPGAEIELPTGNYSSFSAGLGVGYSGSYPNLTSRANGIIYVIAPFVDLQQKWFYNLQKRERQGKTTSNNSGNFISGRIVSRGPSIADNIYRTSDYDWAIGPTWGIQRKYGENFHLLFDVGPQYYIGVEGKSGFFPVMFQLNLGFDL